MTSYGEQFDSLAHRWLVIENEHDKIHPDRGVCGGVGGCTMMAVAVDLQAEMVTAMTAWRGGLPGVALPGRGTTDLGAVKSAVLYEVLTTLDAWINTSRNDHEAMDHRNENTGEECWRTFTPSDIRRMVNDVAHSVGVGEFPLPLRSREDQ